MQRKLITLVVALLALAGFQAKAADIKIGIQTGNFANPTFYGNGGLGAPYYQDERGGYAGRVGNVPNKLTYDGSKFVVVTGQKPNTKSGSADLITVANPSANFITFTSVNGTQLKLQDPGGVWQTQFVVFRQANDAFRVPDYYNAGVGAAGAGNAFAVITPQLLNGGSFEGFIAVQAGGYADDPNLLIVVHDNAGVLSLMKYSAYVAELNGNIAVANKHYPLYVKGLQRAGRWATPDDFAGCKFTQFKFNNTLLEAPDAEYQYKLSTNAKYYSTFTVKQVDYVKDGDVDAAAVTNNILSHTATGGSATPRFTGITPFNGSKYYGCMPFNGDSVIPLFVLASPENKCKVLSVSRINDLTIQSEQNGGFANKLELREYGKYYLWNDAANVKKYEIHTAPQGAINTPNDVLWDQYTSLQKFAIWINEDGEFILYPAATYFWRYGDPKPTQNDDIKPNSVLIYNDIKIKADTEVNKSWGVQIGWWNGRLTSGSVPSYIGTIPSDLQAVNDYGVRNYTLDCNEGNPLTGRFYFLQVNDVDTSGIWRADYFNANPKASINANEDPNVTNSKGTGYQFGRQYVLSTALVAPDKYLVIVPKEINRGLDQAAGEYWRLPYDSVNMAAHWEIQPVAGGGYRLINMLGDTLKYDVPTAGTTNYYILPGGWQSVNWAIPGDPAAVPQTLQKYFGRPEIEGTDPLNWFAPRTAATAATCDVWNIHQMKGSTTFYLEMGCSGAPQTSLVPYTTFGSYNGWFSDNSSLVAGKNTVSGTPYYYYQQYVAVKAEAAGLVSEAGNISACGGMALSMEEISYVPKHGPFYPGEPMNDVTNTNDQGFQKQDSLDAYTFLEGAYDLREATQVDNGLRLGSAQVKINDGTNKTVNVARLAASTEAQVLQFIPVSGKDGQKRTAEIAKFAGYEDAGAMSGIDVLYGETYKWYLVKYKDKYLTFDTINLAAQTNRMKVGFVFEADLINATPVRLYQPLVGDKNLTNFLIQFYMPEYTYVYDKINKTLPLAALQNTFPDIEANSLTAAAIYGGGEVCFATLAGQSNYIFGARAYSSTIAGTRFTPVGKEVPQLCEPQFIDPTWMGAERLLSLPLKNQVWVQDAAIQAWIATGSNNRGIMSRNASTQTTLTHTYVTSIKVYPGDVNAKVGIPRNYYNPTPAAGDTTWIGSSLTTPTKYTSTIHDQNPDPVELGGDGVGFSRDLEVPLYFVQNDANPMLYLTVVPNTAMFTQGTTPSDVSSIRLDWQPRFTWDQAFYDKYGFDRQALQLFAISGCKDLKDGWYGKFIYLPLASYKVEDYKTGTIVQTQSGNTTETNDIFYNWDLGRAMPFSNGNDVQGCWRISQWNAPQLLTNDLVVMTANAKNNAGLSPLEFKLSKMQYLKPKCDYQMVQNTSTSSADKGKYYTFGGTITPPTNAAPMWYTNQIPAHWEINYDATDTYLATFTPELKEVYGTKISPTAAGDYKQTKLNGEYYFVKEISTNKYRIIDVSGYDGGNFKAVFDTITLSCVDHTVPFYDLEEDAHYNLMNRLAILETPYTDRNITFKAGDEITKIYRGGRMIGYQTYLNQVGEDFKNADYLTVYRENRRPLTENHIIPYYSFSVTIDGIEYFLNVDKAGANVNRTDSVYWTVLDGESKKKLIDWEHNTDFLPTYKFCLPYQLNADGSMKDKVDYADSSYPPVYLQTLDLAINDYPDLVIVGAASKFAKSVSLWNAMYPANRASTLKWNIFSVDYSNIDPQQVTAWIFGGQVPAGDLWVPIAGAIKNGSQDGVITNNALNGSSFLDQTGKTPVNYGTLTTVDANNMKVEFEGDTLIGSYALRPIWYYRIIVDGKYLTDATPKDPYSAYYYPFYGNNYPYGYFGAKLDNDATYVSEGIKADPSFIQTFGFRYVKDSSDPDQKFYIVSNANYKNKPTKENEFRFLAQINDQLVFVTDPAYALIFQWGGMDQNGKYTDIQVVGKAGIYGVEGGVKFLSTSGKVDLYSIDGRLIKSEVLTGVEKVVPAPRGIAVVKTGNQVVKVVVQ